MFNQLTDQSDISFYREPFDMGFFQFCLQTMVERIKKSTFSLFQKQVGSSLVDLQTRWSTYLRWCLTGHRCRNERWLSISLSWKNSTYLLLKIDMQVLHDLVKTAETSGMSVSFRNSTSCIWYLARACAVLAHLEPYLPGTENSGSFSSHHSKYIIMITTTWIQKALKIPGHLVAFRFGTQNNPIINKAGLKIDQ